MVADCYLTTPVKNLGSPVRAPRFSLKVPALCPKGITAANYPARHPSAASFQAGLPDAGRMASDGCYPTKAIHEALSQ